LRGDVCFDPDDNSEAVVLNILKEIQQRRALITNALESLPNLNAKLESIGEVTLFSQDEPWRSASEPMVLGKPRRITDPMRPGTTTRSTQSCGKERPLSARQAFGHEAVRGKIP
jgi:hypothetical protein